MPDTIDTTLEHRREAPGKIRFGILVVSTSAAGGGREDVSGGLIGDLVSGAGHIVTGSRLVPDDPLRITEALSDLLDRGAECVVSTGGTGLSTRDITVEAVRPGFEKELTGFPPLFQRLSFEEVGTASILSRATAGIIRGSAVFLLPGSPKAVRLAMERIILPEAGHILKHIRE